MAKKTGNLAAMKQRAAKSAAAVATSGGPPSSTSEDTPKKPFNPIQFAQEVRAEGRKITWTSRKETWITSVMVFIMVVIAALFFFGVDTFLSFVVGQLLKFSTAG
ncbi:preprotein translocase subunit SecE [Caulobacter mirabilis]|nr:preprotein translocase subunit SecE [Caulobacter mirabilis]